MTQAKRVNGWRVVGRLTAQALRLSRANPRTAAFSLVCIVAASTLLIEAFSSTPSGHPIARKPNVSVAQSTDPAIHPAPTEAGGFEGERLPVPRDDRPPHPTRSAFVGRGETGKLRLRDNEAVLVFRSLPALEAFREARAAKDVEATVMAMVLSDQCFAVDAGTVARVIDRNGFMVQECEVRILGGPFAQQSGWIPSEWITP